MKNKNLAIWCVYKHTSPNGWVYIGITSSWDENIRWKNGYGYKHNPHFFNAIQKYGWDNFRHEIIEEDLTCKEAQDLEISLISKYKRLGVSYNITDGGEGHNGIPLTDEHKQKISQTLKEKHSEPWNKGKTGVYSEETRYRMGAGMRGKPGVNLGKKIGPLSQETKRKISESNKGKNTWTKGSKRGPYSEEHRRKISKALMGKNKGKQLGERPDEVKKKISAGRTGQKWMCKPWGPPKQINPKDFDLYLNKGWSFGKLIYINKQYYKWNKNTSSWEQYTPKTCIISK